MIPFAVSQHLLKRKRERQGSGETERENECVCECRPMLTTASVSIHNNTLRERGREHIETHMVNRMR